MAYAIIFLLHISTFLQAVQTGGCNALDGLLTNTTTGLLEFIDKGVAQYVAPPVPHQPPVLPEDVKMVAISSSKLLAALTAWIAQPNAINRLVDCVTNHTGAYIHYMSCVQ